MLMFYGSIISALGMLLTFHESYARFLPDNDLHFEDNIEADAGITEDEFNEVIDMVDAIYRPIVKSHGGRLKFARKWNDSTVNASAQRIFGFWQVNMYGGLARRPEITKDGFTFVVCHELGHHLAGFPFSSHWASNEGNSDYFASLSCGRMLWYDDDEGNEEAALEIPDYPKQLCDEAFYGHGVKRLNLCYREMLAAYSTSNLLATLGQSRIAYDTPDLSKVKKTNHNHPRGQCRLDTYMAGTLCGSKFDVDLIPKNEKQMAASSCHEVNGDSFALRPTCWYNSSL